MSHLINLGGYIFILALGAVAFVLLAHFLLEFAAQAFKVFGWWLAVGGLALGLLLGWGIFIYFNGKGRMDEKQLRPPVCAERAQNPGEKNTVYTCPLMRTLSGKMEKGLRLWRPIEQISPDLRDFAVFLEDAKFFQHPGIDWDQITNAFERDVKRRKLSRGASTITQQLAKNLFLTSDKSFFRKATELPLALRLEKELHKEKILELYLNTIEWGPNIYGAEAAARVYFGHSADTLSASEAILLALMIPNPKELNPWLHPKAVEALQFRAAQFKARTVHEHKYTPAQADQIFGDFNAFLLEWSRRTPAWPRFE